MVKSLHLLTHQLLHTDVLGFELQRNHILGASRGQPVSADLLLTQFPQCGINRVQVIVINIKKRKKLTSFSLKVTSDMLRCLISCICMLTTVCHVCSVRRRMIAVFSQKSARVTTMVDSTTVMTPSPKTATHGEINSVDPLCVCHITVSFVIPR